MSSESESPRLDRIEQIVISLEADMKIMANSVSSMATSMEKFVDIQTDHKLLKQDIKHNYDFVHTKLRSLDSEVIKIKEDMEQCKNDHKDVIERRFKEIEPFIMLVRYPKLAVLSLITLYLMTIKEVRDVVFPFLL